jgi:hypothetical protein
MILQYILVRDDSINIDAGFYRVLGDAYDRSIVDLRLCHNSSLTSVLNSTFSMQVSSTNGSRFKPITAPRGQSGTDLAESI